jgi:hypothetical protein
MSPQGRPEGESAPKRVSTEGSPGSTRAEGKTRGARPGASVPHRHATRYTTMSGQGGAR